MLPEPPRYEVEELSDFSDEESRGRPRSVACCFAVTTLVLVFMLAGGSALAYLFASQRTSRPARSVAVESAGSSSLPVSTATATISPTAEATGSPQPTTAPPVVVEATRSPQQTSTAAGTNRIVLINAEGQVETVSPDGSDRRTLSSAAADLFFQFPTWSPDSSAIAAIGLNRSGSSILVFDAAGQQADGTQVYFSQFRSPFYMYWSPDSSTISFLVNQPRSAMSLNLVPGDGSEPDRQVATGQPFYWDWSADSRQLLIHTGQGNGSRRVSLIDVSGEPVAPDLGPPGAFQAPGIAPSGRYVAFAEDGGRGVTQLVVQSTATGQQSVYGESSSMTMSWSPVADVLAYTSGRVGDHPFWGPLSVVDAETGAARLLTSNAVLAYFWSPDGRSLALITITQEENLDINAGLPGKSVRASRLAAPLLQPGQGFLSLSVIDVESGTGLKLLDFTPTSLYLTQFLPFFDQYALSHRVWSPDSSALVLPVREGEANSVLVVPVDGGRPLRIGEGNSAFWSHD